jgi:hypothetical protein
MRIEPFVSSTLCMVEPDLTRGTVRLKLLTVAAVPESAQQAKVPRRMLASTLKA